MHIAWKNPILRRNLVFQELEMAMFVEDPINDKGSISIMFETVIEIDYQIPERSLS